MSAWLPIPVPATPTTDFIVLDDCYYLAFESGLAPERVVGFPLREMQSGQRVAFVEPQEPILTLNLAAPAVHIPGRTGLFHRVVPYTATLGPQGASILIAPLAEQTHRGGHYVVPQSSLLDLPPATAGMPASIVTPLGGFRIEASEKYMPREERTVRVSWSSETAGEMTRERIYRIFSSDGSVESIHKTGVSESRVTFRSPYAVGPILGGAQTVSYNFWDDGRVFQLLVGSDHIDQERPDPHRRLLIVYEEPLHYAQLHNFFNRFGAVNAVEQLTTDAGQPRAATVFFENSVSVTNTLRGAEALTLYLGEAEIRVRPYPVA